MGTDKDVLKDEELFLKQLYLILERVIMTLLLCTYIESLQGWNRKKVMGQHLQNPQCALQFRLVCCLQQMMHCHLHLTSVAVPPARS